MRNKFVVNVFSVRILGPHTHLIKRHKETILKWNAINHFCGSSESREKNIKNTFTTEKCQVYFCLVEDDSASYRSSLPSYNRLDRSSEDHRTQITMKTKTR